MQYTHRPDALTSPLTYQLGEHALIWHDEKGRNGALEYASIKRVHLQYAPTRVQRDRYRLQLQTHNGKAFSISNSSYVSIGNFASHNREFSDFVRALHHRIAAHSPGATFEQGSSWPGYIATALVLLFTLLVIVLAGLYFLLAGQVMIVLAKLLILAFYVPYLLKYLRNNRPGSYPPEEIPMRLLPQNSD